MQFKQPTRTEADYRALEKKNCVDVTPRIAAAIARARDAELPALVALVLTLDEEEPGSAMIAPTDQLDSVLKSKWDCKKDRPRITPVTIERAAGKLVVRGFAATTLPLDARGLERVELTVDGGALWLTREVVCHRDNARSE